VKKRGCRKEARECRAELEGEFVVRCGEAGALANQFTPAAAPIGLEHHTTLEPFVQFADCFRAGGLAVLVTWKWAVDVLRPTLLLKHGPGDLATFLAAAFTSP